MYHQPFNKFRCFILTLIIIASVVAGVSAQEDSIAPPEIAGEAIYIPFPIQIILDGDLSDWAGIPFITVTKGTMVSEIPGENDQFTFAVAADMENIYMAMTMADINIITQQHGEETWNEDSLEFFFNFTDDINARSYDVGIFQIRLIPADIGNDDPNTLTVAGSYNTDAAVTGHVFETEDGWGLEAAFPITEFMFPEHGEQVGFQAQANGATESNRNVKLIWSNADTTDDSWRDPSLFGTAIFFEVGQTDIPTPGDRVQAEPEVEIEPLTVMISVNQVGYHPDSPKIAAFSQDDSNPVTWSLQQDGVEKASGETLLIGDDSSSGDFVHQIDFSNFREPGEGYQLAIDTMSSEPFNISSSIYSDLKLDALAYFYLNRSGLEIEEDYAGDWARPAGHLTDDNVTCFMGKDANGNDWSGCDYNLDVSRGWYDAGDYGKYVVNGGITVWTLMNSYERNSESFADGSLSIPESSNGIPDILDEARWEMEFLLSMQVPEGQENSGLVHHKMHDLTWETMPALPVTERDNDNEHQDPLSGRYLYPPSTAATLNLAATAAQCSRIWKDIDTEFSKTCLDAAESAWQAALDHPAIFAGPVPGSGGGNYDDQTVSDEFFWAAAELFVATGGESYRDFLVGSPHFGQISSAISSMAWDETAALGTISLALVPNQLPEEQVVELRNKIVSSADGYLGVIDGEGYRMPISDFEWGSNSFILNNMIFMGLAYEFTEDPIYLDGMTESMDYLMGRNPNSLSYIAGYGERAVQHPHHRFWANDPDRGWPPPPPGAVAGGPNATADDPPFNASGLSEMAPAKRYIDELESYSTNEVAINWNAPLVWVSTAIDEYKSGIVPDRDIAEDVEIEGAVAEPTSEDQDSSSVSPWVIIGGIGLLAAGVLAVVWFMRNRPSPT